TRREPSLTAARGDPIAVGVDTVILRNAVGCDSLVITDTLLGPREDTFPTAGRRAPEPVGVDTVFLQNAAGCDSLVITETVLLPGDETFLTAGSCDPLAVGVDTVILRNALGCDSLVITETVLLPSDETLLTGGSCDPLQVGRDTVILRNAAGCDSLVITETVLLPSDETFLTAGSCDPSAVGVDTVFLQNAAGCDSLVITETGLLPSDETLLTAGSCDPSQVGRDTVILQNAAGCDSLVITETVLLPGDETLLTGGSCDPSQVGRDTVILQNAAGCDSLVITETALLPSDETFLTAGSCDPLAVGVDTVFLQNAAGCDSLVITETVLLPSDEAFLTATTCDPSQAGVDTVFLQNTAGCDSLVVTETIFIPSDETFLMASSCDPAAVGVDTLFLQNAAGCDSLVITETVLLPSGETFLMASSCDPSAVGLDTLFLQNTAGCDSLVITETVLLTTDTARIETQLCSGEVLVVNGTEYSEALPSGTEIIPGGSANGCDSVMLVNLTFTEGATGFLEGGRAICPGEAVELTVRLQGATTYNVSISDGTSVVESFTGLSGDVSFTVIPSATTNYRISLFTAVGSLCPVEIGNGTTVTIVGADNIQAEVLTDYGGFGVSCDGSQDATVGVSATGPGLSYQWNTGQTTPTLENVGAGAYIVTVTSTAGCSAVDSVAVTAPAPIIAKTNSAPVDCFNEFSGSILVESLDGGAGPYEYSLDGQFFTPLGALPADITGLGAGNYTLYFQDANDCRAEAAVNVAPFEGLALELGDDRTIKLGDSLQLRPQASFDVASFTWSPLTGILDSAAFRPFVKPMETTAYLLTALDSAGCVARGQIIIFVNKERGLYAPGAFSPNEDGSNDYFTLFAGPDVAAIRTFRIFDRWGALLFEREPFQPNVENLGWDGTFNGEPLDPAVFVFYAEVEYVDGFIEVVEGDFVLVR
ncbi:MAG: T9SS type B sorting domain-containing protein, partial [Phaeodactylibacter sp.]|nr:T9SS type B sorting domain-containing protein [Phaeodactylibacter sp.]